MIIGLDLGGYEIKAGLVRGKTILRRVSLKTEAALGQEVVLRNICKAISALLSAGVLGIGIGSPGPLDLRKGLIVKTPNLPFTNFPLRQKIKRRFGLPVELDNDANCFVLAESLYGAGKGFDFVLGLTLGTGVGGGIVLGKNIFHGRGNAGELGHMTIAYAGPSARCGHPGCLESYLAEAGIMRRARAAGLRASPEELYKLAAARNSTAIRIWSEIGKLLGIGLANLTNAFDPDVIVLGGKISRAARFFLPAAKAELKNRAFFTPPSVKITALGDDAGILGAASLLKSR
jgi:glucokinase